MTAMTNGTTSAPARTLAMSASCLHFVRAPSMAARRKGSRAPARSAARAPDSAARGVEQMFYAGHYAAIVRERVDGGPSRADAAELPFLVGALAFVGRLEDARAFYQSWLRRRAVASDAPAMIAARFFLLVAYCRAGRLDDAARELAQNVRAPCRHAGPLARFYVLQGIGCYRYFSGRLRHAARQALYALELAFAAEFPYGRLLATDLRGHTLVQLGRIREGLSLLETARTLAESLRLPGNAAALECAIGIYRARFGVVKPREAIAELGTLVSRARPDDSYSQRSLRIELAIQCALAGEGDTAWGMLERLGVEHVPDGGDARARIRFLLACANVARLRHGLASMQPFVSEARALVRAHEDIALQVDVACTELLATADPAEAARIRATLDALGRRSGISRAWLRQARGHEADGVGGPSVHDGAMAAEALEEDRLGALYVACAQGSLELASRVIVSGHFGLLPMTLRFEPGRRLLLFDRRLVVEDHGNVTVLSGPPEGTLRLLRALAGRGVRTKEALLEEVWGLRAYRPEAHDPVIHTAVSRLRALLGVRGHWVEAASGGYRLAAGVEVVDVLDDARGSRRSAGGAPAASPLDASAGASAATVRSAIAGASSTASPKASSDASRTANDGRDAILALLAREGGGSSAAVASHLGVSEMTALRRLRELVERGAVRRSGKGKNTRYHLASTQADER